MSSLYSDNKHIGSFSTSTFSVASGTTAVSGGATFTSNEMHVLLPKYVLITPTFRSVSGATGEVDFQFVGIAQPLQTWPNVASFTITATCQGTTQVIGPATEKSVQGFCSLKLLKVVNKNTDDGYAISYVNCDVDAKY